MANSLPGIGVILDDNEAQPSNALLAFTGITFQISIHGTMAPDTPYGEWEPKVWCFLWRLLIKDVHPSVISAFHVKAVVQL
jgi:hypothetical protein